MSSRAKLPGLLALLLVLAGAAWFFSRDLTTGSGDYADPGSAPAAGDRTADPVTGESARAPGSLAGDRSVVAVDPDSVVGVRGVVLDVKDRRPIAGVEVVALRVLPNLERPITRFTSMFREGLWTDTSKPVEILGSAITAGDGTFEMLGLPPGRVYLDARSDRAFVRNPGRVRLARGQIQEGVELLASPGGRIVGQVFDPEGAPATNARVSVRPGLNSFLGQLTQRKYKWLESNTDQEGRFEIAGVPTGDGYSVTFAAPGMALQERHGIDVNLGQTVEMIVHGRIGGSVTGRAIDAAGQPVPGAEVAMVYLDISRMVFSADGRDEPIRTDADGWFRLPHVAPGRVAFIAATDSLAPSNIHELAVVDGGVYTDVVLTLDPGRSFSGLVVDGEDRPLSGVDVVIRPMNLGGGGEQRGSDAMKLALTIRKVETRTGGDGRFSTHGVAGERLSLSFSKPGYIRIDKRGTRVDQKDFKVVLTRGVTVRGRVALADGTAVPRFRVRARPKDQESRRGGRRGGREAEPAQDAGGAAGQAKPEQSAQDAQDTARDAAPGGSSARVRFGTGRGARFDRDGFRGERTVRSREGAEPGGRRGGWDEVKSAEGRFAIQGLPSGEIEVKVQAEGFLEVEEQKVVLAPGAESDELAFVLERGAVARGIVRDAATGQPVAEATVTAYPHKEQTREESGIASFFHSDADPEDFDFLGMASDGRRSAMTDGAGQFEISGLKGGEYRFTARHPDMAKASVKDVEIAPAQPTAGIEILLTSGGAIEGLVTGKGSLPLGNAMVVAFSPSAGSFKSDATDERGFYRIDGLPKGQYIVFKSRMDEASQDIGMDLMSNMRLKTTMVRDNQTTRRDIHDETAGSVRVFGVVRDAGKPVSRAVITMLGRDRDGVLGMGIRTKASNDDGTYEIIGVEPGEYLVQIARFRNRAEQISLSAEIPTSVREFRLDLDLPQSYIEGIVQDRSGNPVAGIPVQVGLQGDAPVDGLVGIMMKNGVGRGRTDETGRFRIERLAAGVYRVTAGGGGASVRQGGIMPDVRIGRQPSTGKWGQVALLDVQLDGVTPQTGLVLTLPLAGRITGIVVDASGHPVAGAAVTAASEDRQRRLVERQERSLIDLFGLQARPIRSGPDGRFAIEGLTPGRYRVQAEVEGLAPGQADDVTVAEGQPVEVRLEVIKGATLHVRVRNIDGSDMPIANITVLDGKRRPVVNNVSAMSLFLSYMKGAKKKDSSGWHEIGGIRPDTYTLIIKEKGQPDIEVVRTVADGEKARWDIDMAEELKRHRESKEGGKRKE